MHDRRNFVICAQENLPFIPDGDRCPGASNPGQLHQLNDEVKSVTDKQKTHSVKGEVRWQTTPSNAFAKSS